MNKPQAIDPGPPPPPGCYKKPDKKAAEPPRPPLSLFSSPNKKIIADLIYKLDKARACTTRDALISALYILQNLFNLNLKYSFRLRSYGAFGYGYKATSNEAAQDIAEGAADHLWTSCVKGYRRQVDIGHPMYYYHYSRGFCLTHHTEDNIKLEINPPPGVDKIKIIGGEIEAVVNYLKGKSEEDIVNAVEAHYNMKHNYLIKDEAEKKSDIYRDYIKAFNEIEALNKKPKKVKGS